MDVKEEIDEITELANKPGTFSKIVDLYDKKLENFLKEGILLKHSPEDDEAALSFHLAERRGGLLYSNQGYHGHSIGQQHTKTGE